MIAGCFGKGQRKSEAYYAQHASDLQVLKKTYDSLYQYQPFSVGYTDKSFKYYFVEFTTDSIRWVYNNETGADSMAATFQRIGYAPERFQRLLEIMKSTKCLWIDKVKRFADGKPAYFTYMSFGSVLVDKPFVENKYYALIFPNDPNALSAVRRSAKRGGIVAINDTVFFTITNRFR
jgi:hypothetical protein